MIKIGLALLMTFNAFAAKKNSPIRGKIIMHDQATYVSAAPGQGVLEYKIEWLKGFPTKNICYVQKDSLCPDYLVHYRSQKTTKQGLVLVDAVATLKY